MSGPAPVHVTLSDGLSAIVEVRGHSFVSGEPVDRGGNDDGPTPMETFLAGIGACTAITLRMYANRKGWALSSVEIELTEARVNRDELASDEIPEGEDREEFPRIVQKVRVKGDLSEEQVQRLAQISTRCPVHRLLTESPVVVDELEHVG